jgi:beta-glucosidase/6-phospho-beta-glucosidase/beta-galactosidase
MGGFANDEILIYFEAYAKVIFENFGDRVSIISDNSLPATVTRKANYMLNTGIL